MDDLEQIDSGLKFETVSNPADTHKSWISKKLHQIEDSFQDATMASEMRIKGETMAKDSRQWLRDVGTDFFQAMVAGHFASRDGSNYSTFDYYLMFLGTRSAIRGIFGSRPPVEIPKNKPVMPRMPRTEKAPR